MKVPKFKKEKCHKS